MLSTITAPPSSVASSKGSARLSLVPPPPEEEEDDDELSQVEGEESEDERQHNHPEVTSGLNEAFAEQLATVDGGESAEEGEEHR
mmetsp:Transcript_79829/g.159418  ORF Transcript_79829/g.159418 Transcript_79829/m.159418 type:complete len:85 (-) Transcript_79829:186-440(-)